MTPATVLRRLADPVRETSVLITTLFFWLLEGIAIEAGILGLWLLFLTVPAYIGYLVLIVEARALGRAPPLLSIHQFNLADGLWRLFPAVTALLWALLYGGAAARSPYLALLVLLLGAGLLPLSLAMLAITHAPLASIDPVAGWRLLRRLGATYLWAPLSVLAAAACLHLLVAAGALEVLLIGASLYWLAACCAVTGGVVATLDVRREIDIDAPLAVSPEVVAAAGERARRDALNHAYALISRDNRRGGFAYLDEFAAASDAPLTVERQLLDGMFRWEQRDAALFYAQRHLGRLLDAGCDVDAMKLMLRCLREDPRFRPLGDDRERLRAAAERLGNRDVARSLAD